MGATNGNAKYCILNGNLLAMGRPDQGFLEGEKVIYEVIRIVNSAPIFLTDHLQRMTNSIALSNLQQINIESIVDALKLLLKKNPVEEQNVKIVCAYENIKADPYCSVFFIPSKYPTVCEREQGVTVKTVNAIRLNPEIKAENKTLRDYADEIITKSGCYEVLMVNDSGLITEGSRSNVFFIKDECVITAPSNLVLGGITREKVLQVCANQRIGISMECLPLHDIGSVQAAFISGTSPGVLPINQIDNIVMNVNTDLIHRIRGGYEDFIELEITKWNKTDNRK